MHHIASLMTDGLLATSQSLRSSVGGWNRGFRTRRWPKTPREVDGRHGGHSSHRRSWKTFWVVESVMQICWNWHFLWCFAIEILLFFDVRLTWYAIVNYNFSFLVAVAAFLQSCLVWGGVELVSSRSDANDVLLELPSASPAGHWSAFGASPETTRMRDFTSEPLPSGDIWCLGNNESWKITTTWPWRHCKWWVQRELSRNGLQPGPRLVNYDLTRYTQIKYVNWSY